MVISSLLYCNVFVDEPIDFLPAASSRCSDMRVGAVPKTDDVVPAEPQGFHVSRRVLNVHVSANLVLPAMVRSSLTPEDSEILKLTKRITMKTQHPMAAHFSQPSHGSLCVRTTPSDVMAQSGAICGL